MPLVNSDNHGIPPNKLIHWLDSTILFTITQLTLGFFLSKHIKTNSAPAFEGAWCHLQCPGHTENLPSTMARCQEGVWKCSQTYANSQWHSITQSSARILSFLYPKKYALVFDDKSQSVPKISVLMGSHSKFTILLHVSVINMRNYKLRLAQDVVEGMQKKRDSNEG